MRRRSRGEPDSDLRESEQVPLLEEGGIEAFINIGGDGSLSIADRLFDKGMRIVGVPKTIDNDVVPVRRRTATVAVALVAPTVIWSEAGVAEPAVEINRLENEADRAHQAAVRRLFEEERDPITIMKWKEILDFLEQATDRCEDVANLIEGVVVKHA